jgi:predicted CXXCH cytochrome family protein
MIEKSLSGVVHMLSTLTKLTGLVFAFTLGTVATAAGLGPLPGGEEVVWSHAPYEVGACGICHQGKDPKNPGPLVKPVNELCFTCHEQLHEDIGARQFVHAPTSVACTTCHNPHNSKYRMLLHNAVPRLCYQCHADIKDLAEKSKVKHDSVTRDKSCLNCHNPHASNVQKLLVQLPYDLCVGCHGVDGVLDHDGKELTNIDRLLKDNPRWHGPVKAKDCSSCHKPHGSPNFRLLVKAYPAKFYAPYDPANYALCFLCHNDQIVATPRTTTLTQFRDGNRNLHYLHVHKQERGRTCRACHDVHASKQSHQIRDGVPYGSSGWVLPINYTETATGGQCARTCHTTRSYDNTSKGN